SARCQSALPAAFHLVIVAAPPSRRNLPERAPWMRAGTCGTPSEDVAGTPGGSELIRGADASSEPGQFTISRPPTLRDPAAPRLELRAERSMNIVRAGRPGAAHVASKDAALRGRRARRPPALRGRGKAYGTPGR